MHVAFVTPEITPYSRSGQIGDVCAALPKALRGMEHKVSVISPLWPSVDPSAYALARRLSTLNAQLRGETVECALYDGRTTGGVELLFVAHDELFDHDDPPNARREIEAALVFAQAAVALGVNLEAEVLHAHGWFGAPALCQARADHPSLARVLSLHDATHRTMPVADIADLQLPSALSSTLAEADGDLLNAGAACAQRIVAPSEADIEQLRTQPAFDARADALVGIVDALDAARWNPLTDPTLVSRFDPIDRTGKTRCKDALQYEWEFPIEPEVPVLLCFGLPHGEGEGAAAIAEPILQNDVALVIAGAKAEDEGLSALAERFADRLVILEQVDDATEHRLIAGADLLLIHEQQPARADLHLRGQRYGALPIAIRRGAWADSIVDCDADLETGSGFLFEESDADEIVACVRRALGAYAKRERFEALRQRVMQLDVSWERSARRYEYMYRQLQSG